MSLLARPLLHPGLWIAESSRQLSSCLRPGTTLGSSRSARMHWRRSPSASLCCCSGRAPTSRCAATSTPRLIFAMSFDSIPVPSSPTACSASSRRGATRTTPLLSTFARRCASTPTTAKPGTGSRSSMHPLLPLFQGQQQVIVFRASLTPLFLARQSRARAAFGPHQLDQPRGQQNSRQPPPRLVVCLRRRGRCRSRAARPARARARRARRA